MNRYCVSIAATRSFRNDEELPDGGKKINVETALHNTPAVVWANSESEAIIKGYEIAQERYSASVGFDAVVVNVVLIRD